MSNKVPQIRFKGYSDAWVQREFVKMVDRVSEASTAELPRVEFEDLISGMGRLNKDVTKPGDTRSGIHFVAGDVLYGKLRPYLNNWLHATFEGLALGDFWVFRTKEMLESSFLYALIQAPKYQQAANLSSGTKMPRSDWKTVSTTEFLVPEKQEQQKIGELFNNLDNLIAANQRKLDLLKEQKKGYLQKMFPRNGAKVPELRFAGFADDWEERKLGNEVLIVMGQSPNSENYTDNPNDHILVQGNADMKNGHVFPRVWTTQVTKQAAKNDLILSVRAPVGDIGKTDYDVVIGRGVAAIKGNEFIFQNLGKMKSDGYWTRYSTGSTFESINSSDIKEAIISVPRIEEQQKIGSFFKQLDNTIALHQRKLELLKEHKKGFLQKMFV